MTRQATPAERLHDGANILRRVLADHEDRVAALHELHPHVQRGLPLPSYLARRVVAHRDLVDGMIDAAFKGDTVDAWLAKLKAAGVPCGRINSVGQALAEPHTAARQMVETVEHRKIGPMKVLGIPFKFSATPGAVQCAPPVLGQQTDEILGQRLGYSKERIAQLREAKAI